MAKKRVYRRFAAHAGLSLVIAIAFYGANVLLLPPAAKFTSTEALFVEGIAFLLMGLLLMIGRGGMNLSTVSAAILSASAEAVCGTEGVGPAEEMRIDSWKSKGFITAGLVLIMTGLFMLAMYFLTL